MPSHASSTALDYVQPLESRRLLSVTPLGPEVTVPMPTELSRFDMAVAASGNFIVVGDPIEQPGSPDVVAFRYSATGEQTGEPLVLDNHGFNVSVAIDADGDAVVAYCKRSGGLYVVRVSKDGDASAPQLIATGSIFDTAVSMHDGGGYFVGWLDNALGDAVRLRAFSAAGAPRGPIFEPEPCGGLDGYGGLELAAKPDGSGTVYTVEHFQEGFVHAAVGIVSSSGVAGNVPSGPSIAGGSPVATDIDVHADGSFVVGFLGFGEAPPFENGVGRETFAGFAQRFDATGTLIGTPIRLGESLPGGGVDQRITSVTLDTMPDGGFIAAFQQGSDAGVTTYARRYSAEGTSIGGALVVDTDPPRGHVIGADANGRVVLAYLQGSFAEVPNSAAEFGTVHIRWLAAAASQLVGAELLVTGTEGDDHIIVERVRQNLFVNVNGIVERFNAADVQFLSVSGLGGDDDIVNASAIPATVSGGDGADTLWGGVGPDELRGFGGNDVLRGGDGEDILFGGTGDDRLHGGNGTDTLNGGAGVDLPLFGEVGDNLPPAMSLQGTILTFNGSAADDLMGISSDGATLSIYSRQSFSLPHAAVTGIVLRGNGGADAFKVHHTLTIPATLDGGSGDDELEGGAGDDLLLGGDGDDGIRGHRGRDTMDGGVGADVMEGDGGLDTADYSLRTGAIDVSLLADGADGEAGEGDTVRAERVLGGAGDDRISGFVHPLIPGDDVAHALFGGPGNDTLNGGAGNDQLFGEAGDDVLLGGEGDDYLEGGAGGDALYGQAGRDALFGLAGNDRLFADDGAADTVRGGDGDDEADADDADDVLAVETVS